ncbi:SRPBCC family protein [Ktedonospora formicarum]|uniref:Polyketide cyclase / dehydrase and lipid transport n=1 Tax=Ktedonospora formicarum TaxID=2778364 RepID=A0A8J3MST2_9CHLR|nr:SRPBCC family protein [Ktedonospora formicarum]GHO44938.1 hypothetical protein KSX_31010 [Ktedonospora formicarum]
MKVVKTVLIKRPIEDVFTYVTDMKKVTEWTPASEIRQIGSGPICVGACYWQAGEFFGRRLEFTTEITQYEAPRQFGLKSLTGPVTLETLMLFEPSGENTRVTMTGEGEPGGLFKFARSLVSSMLDKQLDAQLEKLKRRLEQDS